MIIARQLTEKEEIGVSGNIIELTKQELPANCYVFKHSTRCPISSAAAEEVRNASFSIPLYWINVVEQRALSNWITETYNVQHESPQLLLIEQGKVESNWTHRAIKAAVFAS